MKPTKCSRFLFLGGTIDLIEAAKQGDINSVRDFIEKGTDVNTKEIFGKTSLNLALEKSYTEIVKLLETDK